MYKVFFNHKTAFISTNKQFANNMNVLSIMYAGNYDVLKSIVIDFHENKIENNILEISSENLKQAWDDFCKIFELIEAAGGLVCNLKNEYLFIKRKGKWDLPKGKCEEKEESEKCARREIQEECGISGLKLDKKITDTFHTYNIGKNLALKKTTWYSYKYSGNEQLVPQTEEDITGINWFKPEEIDMVSRSTYPSIYDVLKESGILDLK